MAKGSKKKTSKRRKKPSPADLHALDLRILAAYGLESGCTLSDSDSDADSLSANPGGKQTAMTNNVASEATAHISKSKSAQDHSFVDLHLHSTCSDGLLSPTELVKKAAAHGVRIMALTDHDTMAGVEEAAAAGAELGVRVIPGVEISAFASKPSDPLQGEVIHILAYFPPGGPSNPGDFHRALLRIREGRLVRAKCMVEKLRALGKPITLSRVIEMAGPGVAPGRPHVARALLEAGHVATEKDAFALYLRDDGPAFARGCEIPALEAIPLIRRCGGVSVLAHPWSIRNDTMALVARLATAGLDGMEVYQDSTKIAAYGPLANLHNLLKVGGSDFHGLGVADEREPGRIPFPSPAIEKWFLTARPVWEEALRSHVRAFVREEREGMLSGVKTAEQTLDEARKFSMREQSRVDSLEETCGQREGHDQIASVSSEKKVNQKGSKFVTWSIEHREGSRTLLTPLLLSPSDCSVVEVEAKRLRCLVEESIRTGLKYLSITVS